MAQTGYTPIQLYYSATATNVPLAANLAAGELAINTADGKLFYKDSGGTVRTIASLVTAVANGGTGLTTLTANNVILGNGTSSPTFVAPGTSGNVLTSNGTTWVSSTPASGGVSTISFGTTGLTPSTATSGAVTVAGTLAVANGGTGVTTSTGSGNVVLSTSPTLVTPALGTPSSGNLANCTFPTLNQNTTGSAGLVANALTFSTGIVVSAGSTYNGSAAITISLPQAVATTSNVQFGSFGVGTPASGTAGEIRATNNVTAFYSSDARLKENVKDVDNALDKVCAIGSKTFDWTDNYIASKGGEDGYFIRKSDFGVVAQDVQAVFPQAVRTREDGTLAVDYEKLATLAFGAIKELVKRMEALEAR